ncbi:MAG: MerR family transcriptional regulator [Lachnospiraceae bacterium]|nr:MerR family transcriptional regulator [Lachnospiraceae bacterium]
MLTVNEVSKLTGVSVRSLHHYDAIGLLKPAKVTEAGYRLYGDDELARLQNILLFRELQFPLKQIKTILDSPDFDWQEALAQQIRLLELQLAHMQKLLSFAHRLQEKGVESMDLKAFDAFDKKEIRQYEEEVRERWGRTKAYGEYQQKVKGRTDREQEEIVSQLMERFAEIGKLRQGSPSDEAVQKQVAGIQAFITEYYYQCTDEILRGLGQMYVCDERMKRNIDKAGGEGTAAFVSQAVAVYCDKGSAS